MLAVPDVPEVAQRLAFECEVDEEAHEVSNQCDDDGPADLSESWGYLFWEDAEVQKNDGNFGEDDDGLVEVLLHVEVLGFDVSWERLFGSIV